MLATLVFAAFTIPAAPAQRAPQPPPNATPANQEASSSLRQWSVMEQDHVAAMVEMNWARNARNAWAQNNVADVRTRTLMQIIDEEYWNLVFGRDRDYDRARLAAAQLLERQLDPATEALFFIEGFDFCDRAERENIPALLQRVMPETGKLAVPLEFAFWYQFACIAQTSDAANRMCQALRKLFDSLPAEISGRELDGYAYLLLKVGGLSTQGKERWHPWLRSFLTMQAEIALAWKLRGNGYANTVTEAGWKGFQEHLELAEAAAVACERLAPGAVMASAERMAIHIGMSSGDDVIKQLYRRCLEVNPSVLHPYQMRAQAASPRWGGSRAEMFGLMQGLIDAKSDAIMTYAAFFSLGDTLGRDDEAYKKDPAYGQMLLQLWDHYQKREKAGCLSNWSRRGLAQRVVKELLEGQHRQELLQILRTVDCDRELNFDRQGPDFRAAFCAVLLPSTQWAGLQQTIEARLELHPGVDLARAAAGAELDQLIKQCEEASQECLKAGQRIIAWHFHDWAELAKARRDFLSGKTLTLDFTNQSLWMASAYGTLVVESPTSLRLSSNTGKALVNSRITLTPPYIVECDVEIIEAEKPGVLLPGIAAGLSAIGSCDTQSSGRIAYVNPSSQEFGLTRFFRGGGFLHHQRKDKPKTRGIKAVVWPDGIETMPQGSPIGVCDFNKELEQEFLLPFSPLHVGIGMEGTAACCVRFSRLRVTKLDLSSTPPEEDDAALDYWRKRSELVPHAGNSINYATLLFVRHEFQKTIDACAPWRYMSPEANHLAGKSLCYLGRHAEGFKAMQQAIKKCPPFRSGFSNQVKADICLFTAFDPKVTPAQIDQAIADAEVLLEQRDNLVRTSSFYALARLWLAKGDKVKSAQYYDKAIGLATPDNGAVLKAEKEQILKK